MMASRSVRGIKGVLIDLSGTLYVEDRPTPNAVAAITNLQSSGMKVRYITNTTKESVRCMFQRLQSMGFPIKCDQIFTSLSATKHLLLERQLHPLLLIEDEAMEDFQGLEPRDGQYDSVVVGLAPSKLNYSMMDKAFKILLEGGSLLAMHKSKYYRTNEGLSLGPGPFVTALEYASNVTAQVVGKPNAAFYNTALDDIGCTAAETVMIGDDVTNDIEGSQKIGMKGILVKTGKYREGDESAIIPGPYVVCNDLSEAVKIIDNKINK